MPTPSPCKPARLEATADDFADASTTHLIVADRDGNIVCLTQSLSYHFGACVVAPGTGILLNDSMSNFSTGESTGCNYPAPGKRERSTIAPIIATRDGKPVLALGIPGGQRIPTTTIQLLTDILHFGRPLDVAFDRPRFHVRRPISAEETANIVDLEDDAPAEFDEQLAAMGWKPERHKRNGGLFRRRQRGALSIGRYNAGCRRPAADQCGGRGLSKADVETGFRSAGIVRAMGGRRGLRRRRPSSRWTPISIAASLCLSAFRTLAMTRASHRRSAATRSRSSAATTSTTAPGSGFTSGPTASTGSK